MDKRTIIFVLLVSITFVGLNIFFSRQQDQKNRVFIQEREAKQAASREVLKKELAGRTAKTSDLPLSDIFLDSDSELPITQGIKVDDNLLTVAWTEDLPEVIVTGGNELRLVTPDAMKGGPVLYAPPNFTNLDIGALPSVGTFDIQVVTFPLGEQPQVFLGEMSQGGLNVPLAPLPNNGIVIHKSQSGWLPIGYYNAKENLYISLQDLPLMSSLVHSVAPTETSKITEGEQKYFVLENDYQQLVFTNVGGALVEINLPFESDKNQASVVKEIEFDRQLAREAPANAHFPAHPYYSYDSKEMKEPDQLGGYYPLLRRGIWNKKAISIPPQYYAMNIVSDYPEMAELVYEVTSFTDNKIVMVGRQPHRKITKTYSLPNGDEKAPYVFDLTLQIEGDSRGLWLSSGVPEVEIMSNRSSPIIQYRLSRKGKSDVEKLSLPKAKEIVSVSSVYPDWVVNSNGYLGVISDPLSEIGAGYRATAIPGSQVPTRLSVLDPAHHPFPASKYPGYQTLMPLPERSGTHTFRIYAGPFEEGVLKVVDKTYADPETGYTPDYITCRTFYGWFSFISKPFAKLLFVVMSFFHTITHSWGFSIILLTLFLRLILYPLNAWSIKSMRRMQKLSPQIKAIQAKHKKDPKKAQIEIMTLYREKKVNPFTGCIPILIQLPFLMAMFDLLKSSFQLRGATFIPGWIDNLTAPDVLFQWQTPIFFIGNQFHLLPILLGGVMFIQQRLSSKAPKDPREMTDQQRQQRTMGTIMTVVFVIMFYHFPSGLNLYWLSSMSLGIVQQWLTNKYLDKKDKEPQLIVPPASTKKSGKK